MQLELGDEETKRVRNYDYNVVCASEYFIYSLFHDPDVPFCNYKEDTGCRAMLVYESFSNIQRFTHTRQGVVLHCLVWLN